MAKRGPQNPQIKKIRTLEVVQTEYNNTCFRIGMMKHGIRVTKANIEKEEKILDGLYKQADALNIEYAAKAKTIAKPSEPAQTEQKTPESSAEQVANV